MVISFRETDADLKHFERLRSAGLPVGWLVAAVWIGTTTASATLAAIGFWRASLFLVVFLILLAWIRFSQKPLSISSGDERTLRFTDTHLEQRWKGEIHQTSWAMSLRTQAKAKYWVLLRERLAIAVIPRRAVAAEQVDEFETMLKRFVDSRDSTANAPPVPLWNEAHQRHFKFSIKHQLAPEDLRRENFQKFVPDGPPPDSNEPEPAKPMLTGYGCLIAIASVGVMTFAGTVQRNGLGGELVAGLIGVSLGCVLPVVGFFMVQRIVMKKYFADSPSFFSDEQIYAIDDQGAWQGSPRGFSFIPWSNFQQVMVGSKRLAGLQHSSGLVYVLLKSNFVNDEEMKSFLSFAAERIALAGEPIVDAVVVDLPPDSGNPYQPPTQP